MAEFSRHAPQTWQTVLTTTAGSRNVSLAGIGAYVEIVRVVYPLARSGYQEYDGGDPWRLDPVANVVALLGDGVPDGTRSLRVTALKAHAIAEGTGTVPDEHLETICLGAAAYAMLAYSTPK